MKSKSKASKNQPSSLHRDPKEISKSEVIKKLAKPVKSSKAILSKCSSKKSAFQFRNRP